MPYLCPFVVPMYCTSVGMYNKAVVCSLISLSLPQRSLVKGREGLTEGSCRYNCVNHMPVKMQDHLCIICEFLSIRLLLDLLGSRLAGAVGGAGGVMQGHSLPVYQFTSLYTSPLTAKEAASFMLLLCSCSCCCRLRANSF